MYKDDKEHPLEAGSRVRFNGRNSRYHCLESSDRGVGVKSKWVIGMYVGWKGC